MTRKFCTAVALLLATAFASSAQAAVIEVAPGQSVAAAVRRAQPGDTVRVLPGQYRENVVIDKRLTLEGTRGATLSGGGKGDVVRVRAPGVTVRNLVVRDSGIDMDAQNAAIYIEPGSDGARVEGCTVLASLFGIWLEDSANSTLENNVISGREDLLSTNRGNGIQVYNTTDSRVIGNTISHARDGIYVDWSRRALFRRNVMHHVRYGTHYMNTNDSTWEDNETYQNRGGLALMEVRNLLVRRNKAWGNEDHGIMLRTIQDSVIEDNVVAGNGRGFFIYDAEYNVVRRNLVVGNATGVLLSAGSSNNKVDGNDFIDNREQVEFVASRDVEWGREQPNYWSTYRGWDQDGDGRGDATYEANDIVDRLTWQYPMAKLLLTSPSMQALRFAARQFPVLRAPSVIEQHPRMKPWNPNWSKWNATSPD